MAQHFGCLSQDIPLSTKHIVDIQFFCMKTAGSTNASLWLMMAINRTFMSNTVDSNKSVDVMYADGLQQTFSTGMGLHFL